MGWLGRGKSAVAWGMAAALLILLVPGGAEAKFPLEGDTSEAPPGITVRGIGFAQSDASAARRAVRDAQNRAAQIAAVLGLQVGRVESVDLPELTQFGSFNRRCESRERRSDDCRGPAVVAASVTFEIVGGVAAEGELPVVGASAGVSAAVRPRNHRRSRSIKRAVLEVRREITPQAAAVALRKARTAADAAGLQLGPIISVAEAPPPYYYGSSFYDAALGSFGPGRFCGIFRRPVVRRDPETGLPRVVRRVPHRRCVVNSRYEVHLEVRFEAA